MSLEATRTTAKPYTNTRSEKSAQQPDGMQHVTHYSPPARAPVRLFCSRGRATVGHVTYSLKTHFRRVLR
jgi:hypothetical protein